MEVLLKFQYENKWYFVEKDNKDIKYYTLNYNQKDYNLNSSEIELIKSVLVKVIPSNDRIKLVDFQYKNNTYEIFLDKKNNYYLFNPKPNYKDFIELNYLFNNMNECIFTGERLQMPGEDIAFLKRIIKVGSCAIVIFVSSHFLLAPSINHYVSKYDAKKSDMNYKSYIASTEYTQSLHNQEVINTITNAVNNNPNLTDEEKTKMLDCLTPQLIIDNKNYMDIEYIEKTFSNIKLKYIKKSNNNIYGCYIPIFNTIIFFKVSGLEEVKESTFTHELFHALEKHNYSNYNSFLVETTNAIFNEEYTGFREDSFYTHYYNFTKVLMEIIGSEPLRQYHNYTSIKPIVDSLCEITGNEDDAARLLNNLEIYKKIYDNDLNYIIEGDREANLEKTKEEIINQLETYYSAKYNRSFEDDLVILYYLNEKKLKAKLQLLTGCGQITKEINNIKYFNTQYNNNEIILDLCDSKEHEIEIIEGNYYKDGNKITKEEYDIIFNGLNEEKIKRSEQALDALQASEAEKNVHILTRYDGQYYDKNGQVISKEDFYDNYLGVNKTTKVWREPIKTIFIIDNSNRYLNTENKIQDESKEENQEIFHLY